MSERTVLLVEDHRDSRDIYGTILRHSGYRVLEAADGEECILLAQRHTPDVIVMDLGLPWVDGWHATETLKADPATAAIPVLAVSVHLQEMDRSRARAAGCSGFLPKPCTPGRLLGEVSRILDARP